MMPFLKSIAAKILERHPYGYALGVFLLDKVDALLPHEVDYHGFAILAREHDYSPKVMLDLGANRGHSARAFLKLLPDWKVVSVEASAMHEARLASIKARFADRFDFHIVAATDEAKGKVEFYTPVYRGMALHSASAMTREEALRGVELGFPAQKKHFKVVRTVTPTVAIDNLALDVSFVKIDIQGEELSALRGMESMLARNKPVLLVEMDYEPSRAALISYLAALDYEPWTYNVQKSLFEQGWSDFTAGRNQFFVSASLRDIVPTLRPEHVQNTASIN